MGLAQVPMQQHAHIFLFTYCSCLKEEGALMSKDKVLVKNKMLLSLRFK